MNDQTITTIFILIIEILMLYTVENKDNRAIIVMLGLICVILNNVRWAL